MAFTVPPLPTTKGKRLGISIALLALAVQPLYSLAVSYGAYALAVTPSNMAGWTVTANDGAAAVVTSGDASVGQSALKISTADNNNSRVRVTKEVNVKLSDVGAISFDAKRLTGPEGSANASFRLNIDTNGDNIGDQWVTYETYYNFDATHTANLNAWQTWNVKDGKFWGSWNPAGAYDTNVTLANIPGITTDARIVGISLGMGNYNPNWSSLVDNVVFNGEVYDFEADGPDTTKPQATLVAPATHGPFNSSSQTIQVNATDDRGLNRITANIYKNGSLYKSTSSAASGAKTATHTATVTLPDGTYTIRYNASDLSGNVAATGNFDITIDTAAPGVPELQFPANNATLNTNDFWFTWNAVTDAVSYEWHGSNDPHVDGSGKLDQGFLWDGDYQGVQSVAPTAHSVGANGTWYWQVRAVDAAGNKSAWTSPWSLTIDLNPPSENTGNDNQGEPTETPGGPSTNQGDGDQDTPGDSTSTPTTTPEQPQPQVNNPPQLGIVAQLPFASIITGNGETTTQNDTSSTNTARSSVLGEQDTDKQKGSPLTDTGEVLGASDRTFFGIAWYWYLIIAAALVGGWLLLAAFIRRRRASEA